MNGRQFVLKQIHHEPCDYYAFGNKIESEKTDYARLLKTGIRIPEMLDIDITNERILKEYIEGPTIYELIAKDEKLYYIDYECNPYMEQWNFDNWGDIAIYNLYQRLFFAGDYVKMCTKHLFLYFYVKTSDIISKSEMIRNLNA